MFEFLLDAEVYAPQAPGRCNLLLGYGKILWIGVDEPQMPEELGVVVRDLDEKHLISVLVDAPSRRHGRDAEQFVVLSAARRNG